MKLLDERIEKYLEKKFGKENFDREKYLNPSLDFLRDANTLNDIDLAVKKIKDAINDNKKILIYGDYDSDGICASTVLYLHLKSLGANVDVFIPNRFENGYGISVDAIEIILSDYQPDLIVTVDLGITAVEEVEIIKQEGVDIVITDHHLPLEEVPDCVLIDPKYNNTSYGFDGLCGAGVAYKLVEAISGREQANKYLDIVAIATVGDIVPLVDENRVIAKFGIDKINSGDCLPSLKFLKEKLEIEKLTSTDISFKIVPRLNSCGRMDNAIKVFEFLIQTEKQELEAHYLDIESDNNLRLATIEKSNKIVDKLLQKNNFNEPSILLNGDFHEGTVGIVASRIVHDYAKPTIIFAKTENGTLKGSGRSIENVDLHKIIASMSDKLLNFGGHKMAVGLEIEEDYFEEFKKELNEKILEVSTPEDFLIKKKVSDIELTEEDLEGSFAKQLDLLEPFGEGNEKPKLSIIQKQMIVQPINEKTFKHYKCFTKKNNALVAFNFYKESLICASNFEKEIFVDLNTNYFKGKEQRVCYAKSLEIIKPEFNDDKTDDFLSAIYNKYYSVFDFNKKDNYHLTDDLIGTIKQKFAESNYGTAVIVSTKEDFELVKDLGLDNFISFEPHKNSQNVIVVSPSQVYDLQSVQGYKNIIFLHKYFDEEHLYFSQCMNVFEPTKTNQRPVKLDGDRMIFAKVYKLVDAFSALKANDILDLVKKLGIKDKSISAEQILFSICVFMELNFIEFDDILNVMKILKSKKTEITSSKFYKEIIGG